MILIECIAALFSFAVALTYPLIGNRRLKKIEKRFVQFSRRRGLAILLAGVAALALRAMVLPILPAPYPWIVDEQSYLLQADTFAHGRLTNPSHPLWTHFESPNVIQQPTYSSMYYPAQGAFMALGQVIAKNPFWGVWFSVGVMCAAVCWMLQGWVPPHWALLGGLLCAIRLGAVSYWANSYFGGAVTALGGALVLGALPRIKRGRRVRDALLLGLGFALLINSRPYETLFFSIPIFAALGVWVWRSGEGRQTALFRVAVPFAAVLAVTGAFMLYFFWRTTGNPFVPPYVLNLHTYAVEPNFAWLPLRPIPQYHNEIIRRYWTEWDVQTYQAVRAHPIVTTLFKIFMFWLFYLGPLLSIPVVAMAFARRRGTAQKKSDAKLPFLLIVCAANLLGVLLVVPLTPLYLAPATAAIYGLVMMAMQCVRHWSIGGKPSGIFLVRAVPIAAVALLLVRVAIPIFHLPIANPGGSWTWSASWNQLLPRKQIEGQLRALPGEHLVIVHYGAEHDPRESWVSNSADIDGAKIVWAHDMGPEQNQELLRHFRSRQAWLVEPDQHPVQIVPYKVVGGIAPEMPH
jgi:hypothetical protein